MNLNKSDITMILDSSGSMGKVQNATIDAINEYVGRQATLPNCRFSLITFNDYYKVIAEDVNVKEFAPLTEKTYVPVGNTALVGAIGVTIDRIGKRLGNLSEEERPGRVLVVIQTDGLENYTPHTSWGRMYDMPRVSSMIGHQQDWYKWTFVFLGADQDAIANAASFGIHRNNAQGYANNDTGNRAAFRKFSDSTLNLCSMAPGSVCLDFDELSKPLEEYEKDIEAEKKA